MATGVGEVAYAERGTGQPAVFVPGAFVNADLWEHQLSALGDLRRCLALDLLAHGESAVPDDGHLSASVQADMVVAFLDALALDGVDLVGNDSGGAIAQLVAVRAPERIRTLTLTNCDTHDNWPPAAFGPIREMGLQGVLADALAGLADDPETARVAFGSTFEHPDAIPEDVLKSFFAPFAADRRRAEAVQDYVAGMDCSVTVAIRDDLARFEAPTLIVWGADDEFFDVSWARWLAETIPGTVRCVEIPGGRLFHPLERPEVLRRELRRLWVDVDDSN